MTLARRLIVAFGFNMTLFYATSLYVPSVMNQAVAETFGVSTTVLLGSFTLALLTQAALLPAVGRRIDRLGGRAVLPAAPIFTAAGLVACAFSQGVAQWYAGWLLIGLGLSCGTLDAVYASVGRQLGSEARPVIVGVTMLAGFASAVAWPTGIWLLGLIGWRHTLLLYAAVQMLVILPVTLAVFPKSPPPALPAAKPGNDEPLPQGGEPGWVWLALNFTLIAAVNSMISVHILALLYGFGFGAAEVVTASALYGPAQVAARAFDLLGGKRFTPFSGAMVSAVMIPLALLLLMLGAPALVGMLVIGIGTGMFTIARGALPLHVWGPAGYPVRIGRLARWVFLATALTPTLAAPLVTGWPGYGPASMMFALSLVAAFCLFQLWRGTRRRAKLAA